MENSEAVHIEGVPCLESWDRLRRDPRAVLVDVRTRAEWAFVGVPDLSELGREVVLIEWQSFPDNRVSPDFAERLNTEFGKRGITTDDEIFFICRSGARSHMAAESMAKSGYRRCRNVADGFEGPLDPRRRRSQIAGWKFSGLAWVQG